MSVIVSGGRHCPTAKAFPISTAGTATTHSPSAGFVPLLRQDGLASTYLGMYRSQPWVFAVVNKLALGGARLPLKAYQFAADGESRERVRSHPLARLVSRPAPRVSPFKIKLHLWFDGLVFGKALLLKVRPGPGQPPSELWRVPWENVGVVESDRGIEAFELYLGGQIYPWRPEETLYWEMPRGVSPLEPLRRTLALEDAAIEWQGHSFANGVTPRGAFITDGKLQEQTLPRIRAELEKLYAGPQNAGRFGLFDQGLKWEAMGQSAVDAELLGQRRLSREEVCGAYDVSPPLVGILDRATFNNVLELKKSLYTDSLGPKVTSLEDEWNTQVVYPEAAWDGLFLEHDMGEILRPDPEAQARTFLMAQQSSTLSVNERRRLVNLPPIDHPDADTVLLPANMSPLGSPAPASAPAPSGASLADQLVAQSIVGAAGRDPASTVNPDEEETP